MDNPKQAAGDLKDPLGLVPRCVIHAIARVLRSGAAKYGLWNWRDTPIETMTYVHSTMRHLVAYADGEDIDPESGLPHLAHALGSLAVLVDGIEYGAKDTRHKRKPTMVPPATRVAPDGTVRPAYPHRGPGIPVDLAEPLERCQAWPTRD